MNEQKKHSSVTCYLFSSTWRNIMRLLCLLTLLLLHQGDVEGAAVMSVDLGSEWIKVGVVSPGVPMEIALNHESKRKSPATLAFRDKVRLFGEDALTVGIKDPSASYSYLLDLLGKTIDNPIVEVYKKRFPYYEIIGDAERNTVVFKKDDTTEFSVEELIAQMLMKAKIFAQESTNQPITEAVLTVPGYFGNAEREALLSAAQLAQIKVLQLINDYTAVALNYGVFHPSGINETAQYYIFYDMGASHTSAALVSYQLVKDKHTKETHSVVQVLGVGYDRTLGGLEIQLRLRDYLASEFNAMKKTTTDVTKSPRALAKLFKEAGRLKNVLSANTDHYAQIENLLEDIDFKFQVTREKLEEICSDLWPRVIKPLEQALTTSGLPLSVVSQVILFGGGSRVPKIQEILKKYIQQDLGKSLNADEAAAIGAVYKAADLATGFKVKKFVVKDAVLFPIQVSFQKSTADGADPKQVKRVLFGLMNAYPQKKVITFNKHTDDFDFYVHYSDLNHLSTEEQSYLAGKNITHVELLEIKEQLQRISNESLEIKGIKAYFAIDESGTFHHTGVELIYDKRKVETPDEVEGTLAKLGNTISKLFSKDNQESAKATESDKDEDPQLKDSLEEAQNGTESVPQTENERPADNSTATTDNGTENNDLSSKNETLKIVTVKEPVKYKLTKQFTAPLNGKSYEQSLEKLNAITKAENLRIRLESSFNSLESHIIDVQQKLEEEEYAGCATEEEKQKILNECAHISDWLYGDSITNPNNPDSYEEKLYELRKLTDVFMMRHWEHEERPEALKALTNLIKGAQNFLETAQNLTKDVNPDRDVYTQIEIETLGRMINETIEWQNTETEAQNLLQRFNNVRLTVKLISEKMTALDREVKYLVNKLRIWKPKVAPSKKEKKVDKKDDKTEKEEEPGQEEVNPLDNEEEQVTTAPLEPSTIEEEPPSHTEL